ncbi:family 1 glycosylhydrolase [Sphingomonas nostoxanthinifaciens]|nr:family 1 glycosylhydrolase [Sphingomonas nostoxanthinifaciens]
MLAAGAAAIGSAASKGADAAPTAPKGFLWGCATAAYQVEGNNLNSDNWLLETLPGTPFREKSGDACDHYHRFEQDIALFAQLGFNSYRFSIEWARVEPLPGLFSTAELDHYRAVLLACRKHGLKTVVTLHHFTSPLWFACQGGFQSEAAIVLFARYAERTIRHCGDLIDHLCTFNEANLSFSGFVPAQPLMQAAAAATNAPHFSSFLFDDVAISKPIVRACHRAARRAAKGIWPDLPVGLTLAMADIQSVPPDGPYGASKRAEMYDVWLDEARADDFVGVQTYTRELYGAQGRVEPAAGTVRTQIGQEYYPQALEGTVRYAAGRARVPVIVTENGIGIEDDKIRIAYIEAALAGLRRAMADGCDVRGYMHWSAMDNFEWLFGYAPKFGLIAVDRATQIRQPKPSAYMLGKIARGPDIFGQPRRIS